MVEKNYLRTIGNGSMYDVWNDTSQAPFPGVMFSLDEVRDPTGAVIVPGDASGVTVFNNFFDNHCELPILGLINKDLGNCLDARSNYWGDKLGPASYPEEEVFDCETGDEADANDFSSSIVNYGPVQFIPYVGVHAEATPDSATVETGDSVYFDASGSWTHYMGQVPVGGSCEWEICLFDSYGDGWDYIPNYGGPNLLDVIVDGIVVLDDIFLAGGFGPDCYTFEVQEGSLVEVDYTAFGTYYMENSYIIYDSTGGQVANIVCSAGSASDWSGFAYCGGGGPVFPDPEYYWTFEPTIHSTDKNIAYTYDSAGTYHVSLRVMGHGLGILHAGVNGLPSSKHAIWPNFMFDWDYCKIIVNNPTASLSANADGGNLGGYVTIVDQPVQFYGFASGGTEPYFYEWDLADGNHISRQQNPVTSYREEGTYTVTLTVFDINGAIATDTAEVLVQGEEEIVVNIGGPYSTVVDQAIFFEANAIGGKAPYGYLWDFGDGNHGATSTPFHIYEQPGTYIVTLTVTDSDDKVKTVSTTVTVEAAGSTSVIIKDVRGGLLVTAVIQAGDTPADWTITVDGSVFFGGEASGTIPANMQASVKLPITIGFGKVDITVTANGIQDRYSAFMIGPFVLNVQEA
jgi:PKD repeat protein